MFYLEYSVLPSATHPQHDQMGEGLVCCWRMDVPEDIVFAYDEAEESGSCIVFVHDGDKPND